MGDSEDQGQKQPDPPKTEPSAGEKVIEAPAAPVVAPVDSDDRARVTVPAHRSQPDEASVIVDPSIARVEVSEAQRVATERFADRARLLALICFISAALTLVVVAVSIFGRIEPGVLFFLIPTGIANLLIGILLRRAARSLTASMLPRQLDEKPMIAAFDDLSMAFGVQILATGLFAALLAALLIGALLVRRIANL